MLLQRISSCGPAQAIINPGKRMMLLFRSLPRSCCCFFLATSVAVAEAAPVTNDAGSIPPTPAACLPIDMPTPDFLFSARKKVFAHYFSRFPLSMDNKEAAVDYYSTEYLSPNGENSKWLAHGGFLRSRPIPVPVTGITGYVVDNLKSEIRLALSRGITGFAFDILTPDDLKPGSYLPNMLRAASEIDNRFKIIMMPDMASLGPDIGPVMKIVKDLYDQPGLLHLPDGRLVVAPFLAEAVPVSSWAKLKSQLGADRIEVALMPTFLNQKYIAQYASVGDGFGTFGTPLPSQGSEIKTGAAAAHAAGGIFMAGISGQGYRPKEYRFWESQGSLAYRNSWLGAIQGGADWIQLTTWNDFSETTQVIPYTDRSGSSGTGYFNLTGFYAAWFVTGQKPPITHDVLYYFYRRHPAAAMAPKAGSQTKSAHFWQLGRDEIELVAFLKEPAVLSVSVNGKDYRKSVGAGIQSFSVPLAAGTPHFSLLRNDNVLISFDGKTQIVGGTGPLGGYADLTYWSGSGSAEGTCFSDAIRWQK